MIKHLFAALCAAFIQTPFNREQTTALANDATAKPADLIGIANQIPSGEAKEWLKIPYGQFDHAQGLQVFDREAAQAMANEFNAPVAKFVRWATAGRGGAPIYVGHPDHPAFANEAKDKRAHGWIQELRVDSDGLAMRVKWNPLGLEVLANETFRFFSPNWEAASVPGKTRTYRPVALISAGFTNQPNIPVQPLANEDGMAMPLPDWLAEALGVAPTASKDDVLAAIAAKVDGGKAVATAAKEKAEADMAGMKTEKEKAEGMLANERKAHRALILANAVKAGKITAAQTAEWEGKLNTDFANELPKLEALANVLPVGGKTKGLGARKPEHCDLAQLANEIAKEKKIPFAQAWKLAEAKQAPAA